MENLGPPEGLSPAALHRSLLWGGRSWVVGGAQKMGTQGLVGRQWG